MEVEKLQDTERFLGIPQPYRETFMSEITSINNAFAEEFVTLKKSGKGAKYFEHLKQYVFAYIVLYCEMYKIYIIVEQIFEPFTTNKTYSTQLNKIMIKGRLNNTNNNSYLKPISRLIRSIISKIAKIRILISNSLEGCEKTISSFIFQILTYDNDFNIAFKSSKKNNLIETFNRDMMKASFTELHHKPMHISKRVSIKDFPAPHNVFDTRLVPEIPITYKQRIARSKAAAAAAVQAVNRVSAVSKNRSSSSRGLNRRGAIVRREPKPTTELPTIYRTSNLPNNTRKTQKKHDKNTR
jgi:hypothetical protein